MFVFDTAGVPGDRPAPSNLVAAVEPAVNVLYAQGTRLVNGLRLLYALRSLVREPEAAGRGATDNPTRSQEPAKTCNKRLVATGRA
ncbi:MAG: hypothetical protein ACRD35_06210 [Candidatus Acidiferrales bacterium]